MSRIFFVATIMLLAVLLCAESPPDELPEYYTAENEDFVCPLIAEIEAQREAMWQRQVLFEQMDRTINWLTTITIIFTLLHIITLTMLILCLKRTKAQSEPQK